MKLHKIELFLSTKRDLIDAVFVVEIIAETETDAVQQTLNEWKKQTKTMYNVPSINKVISTSYEIKPGIVHYFMEGL